MLKKLRTFFIVGVLAFMPSCATTGGSNTHWYNPATWFSGSEGRKVEKIAPKLDDAKDKLRKDAQKTAHETQEALKTAPQDNRSVQVAQEANDHTVTNLDQSEGSLSTSEIDVLKKQVSYLISEVATERAAGEKARANERETMQKDSATFAKYNTAFDAANAELLKGFDRENAMANTLRNYKFGLFGTGVLLLLLFVAYCYLKVVAGGVPQALGNVLTRFRVTNPTEAANLTNLLDGVMSKSQQAAVAAHTA